MLQYDELLPQLPCQTVAGYRFLGDERCTAGTFTKSELIEDNFSYAHQDDSNHSKEPCWVVSNRTISIRLDIAIKADTPAIRAKLVLAVYKAQEVIENLQVTQRLTLDK